MLGAVWRTSKAQADSQKAGGTAKKLHLRARQAGIAGIEYRWRSPGVDATSIFVRGLPHGTTDCQANPTPYQRKCCYCHSSEEDKDLRVFLEAGGSACCITRMILHADTGTGCFFFFAHAVFMLSVCFFLPCAAPLLVACSRFDVVLTFYIVSHH